MNLHEFYEGIKSWSDEDLYACLAAIDASTDELYSLYLRDEDDELRAAIEDYELMNNIINRELENR